ncbi:MAG: efflux RND transporter permease subunit [Candidatus Kapabacteria bacterium]|nr:efflux RND transporter permease subunit [Candidatus Kapabacteria bacterium]
MSLSSVSIQRPVLTLVFSLVIILFGVIGFRFLGIRQFPITESPIINVAASYPGASSEVIESQITLPLEDAINGINGIRSITSTSREQRSSIRVEFELGVDLDEAANDVRDKVSSAVRNLPKDAEVPIVSKSDANNDPIVFYNIYSKERSLLSLNDIAVELKDRLQTIQGVSEVRVWGEKRYAMKLFFDPLKMSLYKLTPQDIRLALDRQNVDLPSGRIEGSTTELSVKTSAELKTEEDFNSLILLSDSKSIVRLSDVGYAKLLPENERVLLRRNLQPMLGIAVVAQSGANSVDIANETNKRIEQFRKEVPKDVSISLGFDSTEFVKAAIVEVGETILIALGLVILIIFLFLREWRSTLIPITAIPISLIGTFFIMYLFNFSINILTLLGIVLSIGIVVDDAIVVLENIYSKVESGLSPKEASFLGIKEIFFAIIATTIALVVVFLPVIFLGGLAGRLFREFAIVISGAVIISAFVALTLTPMLCSKLLKHSTSQNWLYKVTEPIFISITSFFSKTLTSFLKKPILGVIILVVACISFVLLYTQLKSELAPLEDRSRLRIMSTAPEGTSYEQMDGYVYSLSSDLKKIIPESEAIISITAPGMGGATAVNSGMSIIILTDPTKRQRSQDQIVSSLNGPLRNYSFAKSFPTQEPTIGERNSGLPIQYILQAPTLEQLKKILPSFLEEAGKNPTFSTVDVNLKFTKPEVNLSINREYATLAGVSPIAIAECIQFAFSGLRYSKFTMNGKQYYVFGEVIKNSSSKPTDIANLFVRSTNGSLVRLDNLVTFSESVSPPQLFRYNRFVSATVSAGLAPGKTIGDGLQEMDKIKASVLGDDFRTSLDGPSRDFAESSSGLLFVFVLALLLIYLTLSAQFESFRYPIIILFTVPLALFGAILSLYVFNQTLNIFSQIGIIMLIGLVTKNGILIVEFANAKYNEGLTLYDAVFEATISRFRPILMTSLSTILGFLPVALALGAGAESRVSMGIAVVGGMLVSTIITLYVIPALYLILTFNKKPKIQNENIYIA